MNQDRLAGSLKQFSGKLKEEWSKLTGHHAGVLSARTYQRAGRMQARCGIVHDAAECQLNAFRSQNRNWRMTNQQAI